MLLSVSPTNALPHHGLYEHPNAESSLFSKCLVFLKCCLIVAFTSTSALQLKARDNQFCDETQTESGCVITPLEDMGCTANDTMDLTVGSDSLPGIMSHCQCRRCNAARFKNQFGEPQTECAAYRAQWLATSSALAFTLETPSSRVLISDSTNPIRQINRADMTFGWKPGLDLSIKRIKWNEHAFELRFIGIETLIANPTTAVGGTVEIHAEVPVFVSDISSIDTRYDSDLYGLEANWTFNTYCPFQYIAGLRYISLDEQLECQLQSPTVPLTYRTNTQNDMYGVQVGITSVPDMPLLDCPWLTWSAKIGLFGNDAEQTSILTGAVGQRADSPADTASFTGEFKLGLQFPLTPCISISGGYTMLLLERVAIAADQLQSTNFFTGSGSNSEGNALFHGGIASLIVHF